MKMGVAGSAKNRKNADRQTLLIYTIEGATATNHAELARLRRKRALNATRRHTAAKTEVALSKKRFMMLVLIV
jgi:hypothetical protein